MMFGFTGGRFNGRRFIGKGARRVAFGTAGLLLVCCALVLWPGQPRADSPDGSLDGAQDAALDAVPLEDQGAAPETESVEIERPFDLWFHPGDDGPLERPDFPPLDEIEPMPFPDGYSAGRSGGPQTGRPVLHDAETGQTVVLDDLDFGPFPQSEEGEWITGGGYRGVDGGIDESFEPNGAFGNMIEINNTGDFPWRMNCKLVQRFEDAGGVSFYFVCSASMYDAETVLTAGHCVYHQTYGWAKEIWVIPGWDGNGNILPIDSLLETYGWARGTSFASWTTWTQNGDLDGDVGLIRVTRAVGMLTGWFGWSHGGDCSFHQGKAYNNASYPAEVCGGALHNGRDMYYWSGSIDSCPNNQLQIDTTGGCFNAGWGGMSGSGAYYIDGSSRYVHAVGSSSDRATWTRYCRQWQSWIDYLNDTFIPGSRGTAFDLQALDANCQPTSINAGGFTTSLDHLATNPTNGSGSGTYTIRVYLSTDDNISSGDTLLSTQTLNWTFGTMSSVRVNMGNVAIPANTPTGNYWLGVEYDSGTDGNAGNNGTDSWDAVPISVFCPTPSAPTGVSATDGTECDFVRITWNSVAGAADYQVYRNGSVITVPITGTSYDDFSAFPGTTYTYTVRAWSQCGTLSGSSAGNTGYRCVIPANDDCFNAQAVSAGSWPFSNENATTDGPLEPSCQFCCTEDNIASDVWFSYVAPSNGRVKLSLCGSTYDTKIGVYEGGCPGAGTLVGCNDDSCGLQSEIEFFTDAGTAYYIRVGGYNGDQGTGTMAITFTPNAVNSCNSIDNLNVLRINNTTGAGTNRIVGAAYDSNIEFSIIKPPAGGNGKFVVHMNPGMPTSGSITPLPASLGNACFSLLISSGATPSAIWTNINKPTQIGTSNFFGTSVPDPARAPTTFYASAGSPVFPIFTSWTIQGVIINPGASSPRGASVTNPVILDVLH